MISSLASRDQTCLLMIFFVRTNEKNNVKIIKHNVATVYSTMEIITIGFLIFYRLGGSLSLSTAQVVNNVNPLSLLGAARVADSVDDVVEAGSQVGVAAVRGTSHLFYVNVHLHRRTPSPSP